MLKWRHPSLLTVFPLPKIEKDKKNGFDASDAAHNEIRARLAATSYASLRFSGTGQILIDHIREIRENLALTTDEGGTRVVIIHPAEALKDDSANAMLKLLEEPPDRCLLILTAVSYRDVIPTILSRCQQLRFPPLQQGEIAETLKIRNGLEPAKAASIAALATGSYTHALELLDQKTDEMTQSSLEFLRSAATGNVGKIVDIVESWLGEDVSRSVSKDRLDITSLWILDALTFIAESESSSTLAIRIPEGRVSASKLGERYGAQRLLSVLNELEEAKLAIDTNALQQMVFTNLAVKLKRIFQS